MLESAYRF